MCGIFGHVGKEAVQSTIKGLQSLEYRGYDSTGIAYVGSDGITICKQQGKLKQMLKLLPTNLNATTAIGHTRWATHGHPSQENAHPIASDSGAVVVVHNGVIENNETIKKSLIEKGYLFRTDTDTEVIANIIEEALNKEKLLSTSIVPTIQRALKELQGAYSLCILLKDNPNQIIAARRGSPLLVGEEEGGSRKSVSSDISAQPPFISSVVYLEDGDMAVIAADKVEIINFDGVRVSRRKEPCDTKVWSIDKGGYPHYMLKEIIEQPQTVLDTAQSIAVQLQEAAVQQFWNWVKKGKRIIICACGTSWHAAHIGKQYIETLARLPVEVAYASEFRYGDPVIEANDVVIFVSQSGETADTLAALREAKQRDAYTFSICNVQKASLTRESDFTCYTQTGIEVGVASTKAFTAQIVAFYVLGVQAAQLRGSVGEERAAQLLSELQQVGKGMQKVIDECKRIIPVAQEFKRVKSFLYLGRGLSFPVALEGALKLKEVSYIHAEGYPAAEMKHGPIALIDEDVPALFVAPKNKLYKKTVSNIEEIKARKGQLIAVATEGDERIAEKVDHVIYIPSVPNELLTPLVSVVPLQFLSYYIAVFLDRDVDQPRNLAKSVTVE